jgi:hypothetical protein
MEVYVWIALIILAFGTGCLFCKGAVEGSGGGSGATYYAIINSPAASYVYTVGGGGAGGSAPTSGNL